ncbi:MAG: DUF86 domain-containing protein [Desulfacinum sp.]|jgi:uncharacterized protein YutE (UPF0331/DUF86 family)|nr:DUF86 domain-containing protein [Desulfacinum sp.]
MTPGQLRRTVVVERTAWVRAMLQGIRQLPLESFENFAGDPRNPAAAESYLRRALEGLLDLGRHLLAKGFGLAATEYKEIGRELERVGVLNREEGMRLRQLAGYRNRLVHFYHEVGLEELYDICTHHIGDIENLLETFLSWIKSHPEKIDTAL